MKYALIQDNRIAQIADKKFPVHNSMKWLPVPNTVTVQTHWYNKDTKAIELVPKAPEKTTEQLLADKLLQLKEYRKLKEEAGIVLNSISVQTDRDSQSLILGARVAADSDPGYTVEWKAGSGWVTLNAQTIRAMSNAVRAHVQACFSAEKYHDEILRGIAASNNRAALQNYTFAEGWPV